MSRDSSTIYNPEDIIKKEARGLVICRFWRNSRYKKELTKNIELQIPVPTFSIISEESKQEASISQIIRTYGKHFTQVRKRYIDGLGGRCVMGLIMSYYGWDGKCITNVERRLYAALVALRRAGISKELLIELNDSGATFDDIADYLDKNCGLASNNR